MTHPQPARYAVLAAPITQLHGPGGPHPLSVAYACMRACSVATAFRRKVAATGSTTADYTLVDRWAKAKQRELQQLFDQIDALPKGAVKILLERDDPRGRLGAMIISRPLPNGDLVAINGDRWSGKGDRATHWWLSA